MNKNFKEVSTSKNESAFERAEKIRYEKLRNAPEQSNEYYPELNLEGCTQKEILLGF